MLEAFNGTILLVSHDRYLIDALATQIWELTPGELNPYDGGYQLFLRARNRRSQQEAAEEKLSFKPARQAATDGQR